jgi:hypothetical protein
VFSEQRREADNLSPKAALLSDELIVSVHEPWTEVAFLPRAVDISAKLSARNVGCKICSPGIRPRDIGHKPGQPERLAAIF